MNVRENLKAYLDGELSAEEMQQVARALESDAALREELEFMRMLGLEIKRVAPQVNPVGAASVAAAIRQRSRFALPSTRFGRFGLAIGGACAAILVFAFIIPSFNQARQSRSSDSVAADAVARRYAAEYPPEAKAEAPAGGAEFQRDRSQENVGAGLSGKATPQMTDSEQADSPPNMAIVQPERMVIRNGSITVRVGGGETSSEPSTEKGKVKRAIYVETVAQAVEQVTTMAKSFGGYVESASYSGMQGRLPTAMVTLRVASKQFDAAMQSIREMGAVIAESMSGEDVTAQYADIEGRLGVLKAEADSYVTMLRAARKVGEIMEIKDRLSQVRQQIESFENQRRSLKSLSSLSTISATFQQRVEVGKPRPGEEDWSGSAWARAVNGLMTALQFLGQAAIYVFVYAPIWLPIILIAWLIARKNRIAR